MGRILFWVLLIVAMAFAWQLSRKRNALSNKERQELYRLRGRYRREQEARTSGEPLDECPTCGKFFPRSSGYHSKGKNYCSKECAKKKKG